ncbi:MAG: pyridoxal phosphate-dependent aminotransferase [Candidatus Nanopelagicales bacterium]|nr:pyridoxal phosphate-dependent aminotransferase [Candidatus Nanopelagicales bacterium]
MPRRRPPLVARMAPHGTSVFGEMSRLAQELGAINLGQGFPDTDGPSAMKAAAIAAITDGRGNQYPPVNGLPQLRLAIAEHQARRYGIELDPDTDVVVTTGASEAIAAAVLALIEPGDEVVVLEPWFDVYDAVIALARGVRVGVPMNVDGLRPDLERMRAAITTRTRVLLLNSPHNPTGVVLTRDELQVIADLAIEHDLIVVSDEAYEHLWFDDSVHIPIATLPGMHERTITVGSGGKTFSFTGWKVGWASGPADLIAAVRTVRQHLSYVSGGPFQWALVEGLHLPEQYFVDFRADLAAKRDLLCTGLESLGFDVLWPQGTYFATTDVRSVGYTSGLQFCRDLPVRAGVVAIPHQVFCSDVSIGEPFVRWAFCKQPAVLESALDRLRAVFGD